MKAAPSSSSPSSPALKVAALLAVILLVLFWRSFLPGYVHFSNDGPLGQQHAAYVQLPAGFTGSWNDLNDIGNNVGAWPADLNALCRWLMGAVLYAKFFAPLTLFFLGFSAWCFFRQLKFSPLAATLGALAAALNSTFFATACWGVAGQLNAFSMDFLALALVISITKDTPRLVGFLRLALAGLAVGINVMEAADIGAIFSLFVAAFVLFDAVTDENGSFLTKFGRGVGRVALIAVFAGFIATQTVVALVGSQIAGIAGTGQDLETKAQHWDWATQWSLPKKETLGLFVPGLFGYRMDTPKGMMEFLQPGYEGGNYWGGVGRDPGIDRFFDSGQEGSPPPGLMRFTGGGNYAGVLVTLVALWAIAQLWRRENPGFTRRQRRFIGFWSVILLVTLLLSFGRFAPFYKWLYMLPYVSTMRNPCKFMAVFTWALVILFGYGVHGLSRRYLEIPAANPLGPGAQLKSWWAKVRGFDRHWTLLCLLAFAGSVVGWLIFATEKPAFVHYLQFRGFTDERFAREIAGFCLGQISWFLVLLALSIGLCVLILAGFFAGRRAKAGGFLLGALLVLDLGRANLPYIIHLDYKEKYEIGTLNPIVDFLRTKPYEYRVAGLPFNMPPNLPGYNSWFSDLYRIEWAQHHFPYYNVQSLDKIQMPRMASDLATYELTLAPRSEETLYLMARHWELTSTRYLLGPAGFLDVMNERLDPAQHRFRILRSFDVVPKPGEMQPSHLEQLTAVPAANGACALFEFTAALPRARLFANWQVNTNNEATLKLLASTNFDPWQTVLVSTPLPAPAAPNQDAGPVEFKSYSPKDIRLDAQVAVPAVLLLNDKFDPYWRVLVDGKPAELLRCNYIMRGVYLTPGQHTVEFHFRLPSKPLYISLVAIATGLLLGGVLLFLSRRRPPNRT
jgi:hypothetical protein